MPNKMPSLLDLILTSEESMIRDLEHCPPLENSHHDCLTFKIMCYAKFQKNDPVVRDLRNADFAAIVHAIEQSGIHESLHHLNAQEDWECLKGLLSNLEDMHIPLKKRNKKEKQPYSTAGLLQEKRKKDCLFGHFRPTRDTETQTKFWDTETQTKFKHAK